MRARATDWALFVLVGFEFISGFISFTVGRPEGRLLFVVHGMAGLMLVVLLFWKLRRVRQRLTQRARWQKATAVSVAVIAAALGSLVTGIVWTSAQWPLGYPNGMILHTSFGIALVVLYLWHTLLRYRPLSRRDIQDRRTVLSAFGAFTLGAMAWTVQDRAVRLLDLPGAKRRFTGSRSAGTGEGNGAFPVTSWMFDRPLPLDTSGYRLRVGGLVDQPRVYTVETLHELSVDELVATIDCTGGWYATQRWQGISVGRLLAQAGLEPGARFVRFVSTTGYRWSLPLEEAHAALLATHVSDEPLSHGHGAPLRLVAPGRRGFQWVKWVVAVHVTADLDLDQWRLIFTSGLGATRS